jgi:hypothetical protein
MAAPTKAALVKKVLANSEPFSNPHLLCQVVALFIVTLAPGVMVLSAVGIGRRIIRF